MKKTLLIAAAFVLTVVNINAQEPTEYPGYTFNSVSATGKYAASYSYGSVAICNLTTGEFQEYLGDIEMLGYEYSVGGSKCISDNGILVGQKTTSEGEFAGYIKDGQWFNLDNSNRSMSIAYGITPDGKRIVGAVAPENHLGDYRGLMLQPCYWDEQADGTYGEFHLLPCPTKDFTGAAPQYVTAFVASEDGKTIAGQIQDCVGFVCQPIVFFQGEDDKWEYDLINDELFHPEGFELPENPGDSPEKTDFMTEEEYAAYQNAVDNWDGDFDNYPNLNDFMSEEEIAAYEAADEAYWDKYPAFSEAYNQLLEIIPLFDFNNVFLTSDGNTYATTHVTQQFDPMTWQMSTIRVPYVLNLRDKTYKTYPDNEDPIAVTSIADDGTVFAAKLADIFVSYEPVSVAYILPAGNEQFVKFYDYIASNYPTLGEWMIEHMTHEYEDIDMTTYETFMAEALWTGMPFASADKTVVATTVPNYWDYETIANSYVLPLGALTGINSAMVRGDGIKVQDGKLVFGDDVKSATIYNMSGAQVFATSATGSSISTGLNAGIYLVKVVAADGTVSTVKVAF